MCRRVYGTEDDTELELNLNPLTLHRKVKVERRNKAIVEVKAKQGDCKPKTP